MNIQKYMETEGEKPLDNIVNDGGFCKIFRTIGCIGDSLSSGEFESRTEEGDMGYHDYYEYSWGQCIAREAGVKVLNFSRGGMSAKEYLESFAIMNDYWSEDKLCQAYIIALGVNDLFGDNEKMGTADDIKIGACGENSKTFAGYYGRIIQKLKSLQPYAKFFLVTMPKKGKDYHDPIAKEHSILLNSIAQKFTNTYVIDLYEYAPVYDDIFYENFFLGGHMNPQGYIITAKMIMSYIDYIIRNNPKDFAQVPFIGKPYYNPDYPR